jgi:ABC-type glutathione transport system ATPase component
MTAASFVECMRAKMPCTGLRCFAANSARLAVAAAQLLQSCHLQKKTQIHIMQQSLPPAHTVAAEHVTSLLLPLQVRPGEVLALMGPSGSG